MLYGVIVYLFEPVLESLEYTHLSYKWKVYGHHARVHGPQYLLMIWWDSFRLLILFECINARFEMGYGELPSTVFSFPFRDVEWHLSRLSTFTWPHCIRLVCEIKP